MARRSTKDDGPVKRKVYVVWLKKPLPNTPPVLFFGSKIAIFEYFGGKALGLTYNTARTLHFDETFENGICSIAEGYVLTNDCPEITERREREGRDKIQLVGWSTYVRKDKRKEASDEQA